MQWTLTLAGCRIQIHVFKVLRNALLAVTVVPLCIPIIQLTSFLLGLYLDSSEGRAATCIEKNLLAEKTETYSHYPRHIHQVYFNINDKAMREDYQAAQSTWPSLNPDFKHTLWNASAVLALIETHYPGLVPLYNSYPDWISQVDIGRLVVLYHFGGIYFDMDFKGTNPLRGLYDEISHQPDSYLVTVDTGINTDVMISKPKSRFMGHVLCGLESAKYRYFLPHLRVMFTAGAAYMALQYLTYDRESVVALLDRQVALKYIKHFNGGSWYSLDSLLIIRISERVVQFRRMIVATLFTAVLAYTLYRISQRWRHRRPNIQQFTMKTHVMSFLQR